MKTIRAIVIISTFFLLTGCYPGIRGKVVDGVSGNPLNGAVVLAQWTTTGGLPGLSHHSVYKIEETETDKDGMFSISGVYNPFVNPPEMVVYKKGFVPWRNDKNFKDKKWTLYDDIIWKNNITYRLEQWRDEYSKEALSLFIGSGIIGSNFNITPKYSTIKSAISKEVQTEIDMLRNNK
ncbi:MAG: carboxypeptidase-like regulatory domain-containing protein [Pedobacter sp.]